MSDTLDSIANSLFNFAVEIHSELKNEKWHAAALLDGRRLIYKGYNNRTSNTVTPTCHAEFHVVSQFLKRRRASSKISLKGFALFVIRVKRCDNSLGNSKPCYDCINMMTKYGIKTVYYSNDSGEIVMERVNRMENNRSVGCQRLFDGTFQ